MCSGNEEYIWEIFPMDNQTALHILLGVNWMYLTIGALKAIMINSFLNQTEIVLENNRVRLKKYI